jgi:hypothetical protein
MTRPRTGLGERAYPYLFRSRYHLGFRDTHH